VPVSIMISFYISDIPVTGGSDGRGVVVVVVGIAVVVVVVVVGVVVVVDVVVVVLEAVVVAAIHPMLFHTCEQ